MAPNKTKLTPEQKKEIRRRYASYLESVKVTTTRAPTHILKKYGITNAHNWVSKTRNGIWPNHFTDEEKKKEILALYAEYDWHKKNRQENSIDVLKVEFNVCPSRVKKIYFGHESIYPVKRRKTKKVLDFIPKGIVNEFLMQKIV